jgi:hypothetical protein
MLRKFDSGVKVIQTKTHSDDEVILGNNKSRYHFFASISSSAARHSRSVPAATQEKFVLIMFPGKSDSYRDTEF